jgi:D-Tyr-tRNAtyr deacylase
MYSTFLENLGQAYKPEKIQGMIDIMSSCEWKLNGTKPDGRFGAMMSVSLTNEVNLTSFLAFHVRLITYPTPRDL